MVDTSDIVEQCDQRSTAMRRRTALFLQRWGALSQIRYMHHIMLQAHHRHDLPPMYYSHHISITEIAGVNVDASRCQGVRQNTWAKTTVFFNQVSGMHRPSEPSRRKAPPGCHFNITPMDQPEIRGVSTNSPFGADKHDGLTISSYRAERGISKVGMVSILSSSSSRMIVNCDSDCCLPNPWRSWIHSVASHGIHSLLWRS